MTDNSDPTPPPAEPASATPTPTPTPTQKSSAPEISMDPNTMGNANLIYILYLAGFIVSGITAIVGVIMAFTAKDEASEALQTHYKHAINIFWKGLIYSVGGMILTFTIIGAIVGIPMMLWGTVWYIIRCVKGIQAAGKGEPIPDPDTWGI